MVPDRESAFDRDPGLPLLDFRIEKLLDSPAVDAYEVIVVVALVQLEHGLAGFEVMAGEQSGLLELRQHAIDRSQPHVEPVAQQQPVDVLGRKVADRAVLEQIEDLQPRRRCLESDGLQILGSAHTLVRSGAGADGYNTTIPIRRHSLMRRAAAAICFLVAGCSWVPTWGVYKIDVNQGNFITQDLVEKLKTGQTKPQVRLILGTPLVADAFHANRWDYVFRYESGGRVLEERKFNVQFQDDKLAKWGGEEFPISPVRGYAGERKEGVTTSISADDKSWWGTIRDIFGW